MQILFHILHLHFCKCAEVVLIRTFSVPLRIQTGSAGFELFKMCFEQLPDDFFQFILSLPSIPLIFSLPSSHLQLKNSELKYCVQNLSLEYHMKEKEI